MYPIIERLTRYEIQESTIPVNILHLILVPSSSIILTVTCKSPAGTSISRKIYFKVETSLIFLKSVVSNPIYSNG